MKPLEEDGAVHAFHPPTATWTKLAPTSKVFPSPRSYHAGTVTPTHLVIHAGCPASGRVNDTWIFDVASRAWSQLPDAPGEGRGGTAIAYAAGKLWRFGGFNGKTEVGGAIDALPIEQGTASSWSTYSFGEEAGLGRDSGDAGALKSGSDAGPGQRSVHALVPVGDQLVTFFGEGKPSPTGGHDAAGNFYDDVWAYDATSGTWKEVHVSGESPCARGWFASSGTGSQAILWGGINASNERLPDGFILSAE